MRRRLIVGGIALVTGGQAPQLEALWASAPGIHAGGVFGANGSVANGQGLKAAAIYRTQPGRALAGSPGGCLGESQNNAVDCSPT